MIDFSSSSPLWSFTDMLGSHVGGRGWGGPEIWLTDRQMFALRGDSMSLRIDNFTSCTEYNEFTGQCSSAHKFLCLDMFQ